MTVEWYGDQVLNASKIALDISSKKVAEIVMEDAKKILKQKAKTTTEQGLLSQFYTQKSKFKDGGYVVHCQGPDNWRKPYHACVLGYDTWVKTDKGNKEIGGIKVGDFVIGQDGLPHKVNYISNFFATEKPDLVKIQIEFMRDKDHILTVTNDHKILTFKNGVSFWAKAGDLKENDIVFTAIKKAHNKGQYTGKIKICINCNKNFQTKGKENQGEKYCGAACRWEHWKNGNNWHTGKKRSKETCKKISDKILELLEKNPEKHINRRLAKKGFQTSIEKKVEKWLKLIGIKYEKQFRIGKNFIDFAIPSMNLLIEADGAYWHKKQSIDIKRDINILSHIPDATIIHIHFADKRFTPKLDNNPIDNVFYIQCNDSMNSFINLDYFKPSKIIKTTHFEYKATSGKGKKLYDLSIDDVHSFIASGIVVSNSFFEMGTYKDIAHPFMRPAAKKNKRKANQMFKEAMERL